jgi:glycosyltransferase-like protein
MTAPRPSVGVFTYSTVPRGSVVHAAALADALADAGWPVTLYALDKDGRGFFRPLRAALRLVPAAPAPSSTAALVRQRARELSSYLQRRAPRHDIFHAQDCLTASGLLATRAARPMRSAQPTRAAQPIIVRTVHHVERFDDVELARCQEWSICRADLCLSVSEAARRDVHATFGVGSAVVGNGVDVARFRSADPARVAALRARLGGGGGGPLLLTVGGVEPRKNTLRVLQAFARVRAAHPRARLWILGGATVLDHGAYRADFEHARAALDAPARAAVHELGVLPEDDVPALFELADALVLPSLHEGFGLAALEALAAGVPVVASARPPFTEFLDESCATLVDPLSVEAIADGVARALEDSAARREAGHRRADAHAWSRVAVRHVQHYERIFHARDALHRSLA